MALIAAPLITGIKYLLKLDDSTIHLKVTIGNGQLGEGGYTLKSSLRTPPVSGGVLQSGLPVELGADKDLSGKILSLLVTVIATQSLDTGISIELTGGTVSVKLPKSVKAKQIGDVVSYEAYLRFTKS